MRIFGCWSESILQGRLTANTLSHLRTELSARKTFPTTAGTWVALGQGLVIDDDTELSQLFSGAQGLHMLRVPAPVGRGDPRRRWV